VDHPDVSRLFVQILKTHSAIVLMVLTIGIEKNAGAEHAIDIERRTPLEEISLLIQRS
jgi:hypothetical protein